MNRMIRYAVEQFSRWRVLKRRLPSEFGGARLFVSPDSRIGYWRLNMMKVDPFLFQCVRNWIAKGDVVWDIGANVGLFTFSAAWKVGSEGMVLGVEPDPFMVNLLFRTSRALPSGYSDIIIVSAAVGGQDELATLEIANRGRSSNYLTESNGRSQSSGSRGEIQVAKMMLDSLLTRFESPNVVKIDVEGAEIDVLDGARLLLETVKPLLICETGASQQKNVHVFLTEYDYLIFNPSDEKLLNPLNYCPFNFIAVHRNKMGDN